jgi:hypothetical protein
LSTGPKPETRGGYREGAGRKRELLSVRQVSEMLAKAKEWAEQEGKTIDDILLMFIYDKELTAKDRLASIKLWKEYTIAKLQEGGETDEALGPAVFLPAQHPRLVAVEK